MYFLWAVITSMLVYILYNSFLSFWVFVYLFIYLFIYLMLPFVQRLICFYGHKLIFTSISQRRTSWNYILWRSGWAV
ncbi:MAG: hypothetical protein N7Q72_01595, partial [Spiroplasma sp. Tabriz.8]|nr:hypothetical protein [Spiroplasma sp. Tabriz.8]